MRRRARGRGAKDSDVGQCRDHEKSEAALQTKDASTLAVVEKRFASKQKQVQRVFRRTHFWAGCSLEHFWNLLAHWRAFHDSRHMGRDVVLPSRWSRSSASSKSALAALSSEAGGSGKEAFQVTPLQKFSGSRLQHGALHVRRRRGSNCTAERGDPRRHESPVQHFHYPKRSPALGGGGAGPVHPPGVALHREPYAPSNDYCDAVFIESGGWAAGRAYGGPVASGCPAAAAARWCWRHHVDPWRRHHGRCCRSGLRLCR